MLRCALLLGAACGHAPPAAPVTAKPAVAYPPAPQAQVVEAHQGVQVADPYRPLEDLNSAQTVAWVAAENRLTDAYFASVSSLPWLRSRLAQVSSYEKYGLPIRRGGRYFWTHNSGKQDQAVLLTAERLDQAPTPLVDPSLVSPDGSLQFAGYVASNDGKRVAYGLSIGGGDWMKWRVRSVDGASDAAAEAAEELQHLKYYPPAFLLTAVASTTAAFLRHSRARRFPRPTMTVFCISMRWAQPPPATRSSIPGPTTRAGSLSRP